MLLLRPVVEARGLVALIMAGLIGVWGLYTYPMNHDNVFLALVALQNPAVFKVFSYGYATFWFTTPFLAASLVLSMVALVVYRRVPAARHRALPPYPSPETRPAPTLVLGERHFATKPGPAPAPRWLTIPQRGLYTGVMVLGAVGTGKTSAALYPFTEQLLRWRADDRDRKIGGLVLEVKGDFCRQVRDILTHAGRAEDYIEIGLSGNVCYNPLHNDLDPYALAYAIGSLLNNLHGRSKEPFWQQAYTDLVKFVILHATSRRRVHHTRGRLPVHPQRGPVRHGARTAAEPPAGAAGSDRHPQGGLPHPLRDESTLGTLVPGGRGAHGAPVRWGAGSLPQWPPRPGRRPTNPE